MSDIINPEDMEGLSPSEQKDLMKEWFFQHFEDPAERTPYESAEGGYIWIWGGPHDAAEELESAFSEYVEQEVIDDLVGELECYCLEWAPTPSPGDYDDYIIDDISSITEAHENFCKAIKDVRKLLEVYIPPELESQYCRLLYVNVITAIETFLSDAFISQVMSKESHFKNFVNSNPEFKKQKLPLSDIFEVMDELQSKVKSHLLEVVWHNLKRVSEMYKATLNITFPDDLGDIYRAILKRHDIVHRNGKNKQGVEIVISKTDVLTLIGKVENFASDLDWHLGDGAFDF